MSPMEIRMLLHYHVSPLDYHEDQEEAHARSSAVASSLQWFIQHGLLTSRYQDVHWAINVAPFTDTYLGAVVDRPIFAITEKGTVMVEHLCAVKVPVCKWVQPEEDT